MCDYLSWHDEAYRDSGSPLSWRLSRVRHHVEQVLDAAAGRPVKVLSLCAGDGRDLIGVLSTRPDRDRVSGTLVELHPQLAGRARTAIAAGDLRLEVLEADAGDPAVCEGLIPADLVLMVGIFGNISDEDLERAIRAAPAFCRPGGTLIWSRGRDADILDLNEKVRAWYAEAGLSEVAYEKLDDADGELPALGVVRHDGETVPLDASRRLFTFIR
ncbi:hypothetical protein Kisp01_42530 [Kineosporia sp. NBRC 101677]|uniref:class I SAM-dependent methyltransferase n=1 Tax=Kineosporia sp. NBRC 101677 TaxID=3032197 RepID=UPI0024A46537|nr:class I SAM-dependent methyltransferase [Kineosporia sp. NBRC 101677]GLY17238.1 hypothetical protein Kisp01_42530 [Kineosporia sp. NBRC 101677]